MSDRTPDEIASEMAQHYLALGALWTEWARSDNKRRPKSARRVESADELRRKIERKVKAHG